jgi:hypothetical protein
MEVSMAGSTIGSKITTGVTLGSTTGPGIYLSPLTVTPLGYIAPSSYDVAGISASISAGYVLNQGQISAGAGTQGGTVGDGGTGGGGVGLSAGSLTNDGTVTGGTGGDAGTGGGNGGHGGYGIDLAGALLINSGKIAGGDGGLGVFKYVPYVLIGFGGTGGTGAILVSGALFNSGTISGVGLVLDAGSLNNQGLIIGGKPGSSPSHDHDSGRVGAVVYSGSLTNTGTISGRKTPNGDASGVDGIVITGGNVVNRGTINGGDAGYTRVGSGPSGGDGVTLAAGSLTNYGMISGGKAGPGHTYDGPGGAGVTISGGTLTNHGTIAGGTRFEYHLKLSREAGTGVDLSAGSLINDGTITGGYARQGIGGVGVDFRNGGTLTNDGFISRGANPFTQITADAVDFGNGASRLILGNAAVFSGAVVANAAYSNVLELTSSTGAGMITSLGDTISGFQTVTIDPGASWFIGGNTAGLAAGQTIDGFTVHDTIELAGITAIGSNYAGGVLTLASTGGPVMLDLPGGFTTGDFIVNNAAAGADITVVCFRAGTRIRVTGGTVPVEELCIGEPVLVLTPDGRLTPRPIVWIGHRSVDCRHHPNPHLVWPVRIRAGAFGPDAPCRDLFLSPDHAVFVDGALIPVKYLINGDSIQQVPLDEVTYFHIELQEHSVLLAEDLPAESYLDTGDRTKFANGGKQSTLFPDFATRVWEAAGCAPLVVTGAALDAARRRINGRKPVTAPAKCSGKASSTRECQSAIA